MSYKYLALCWLVTLEILEVHGDDCADVTQSCLLMAQKETNSTDKCTVGQAYYDCLGKALPAAQAAGICDATGILKHRFYAFVDLLPTLPVPLVVDVRGCNTKRPAYFDMTPCDKDMLRCVLQPLQEFRGSTNQTLSDESCRSSMKNFEVCMTTQTPQCPDRNLVAEVIRIVKKEYSKQFKCNATSINIIVTLPPLSTPATLPTTADVITIIAVTIASLCVVIIAFVFMVICRWKCRHLCDRGLESSHRRSSNSSIYDDVDSIPPSTTSSDYDKIGFVPSIYDKKFASSICAGGSDWSTLGLGSPINPSILSFDPASGDQVSGQSQRCPRVMI